MAAAAKGQGARVRDLLALSGTAPVVPEATEAAEREEEEKEPPVSKKPNLDISSGSDASDSPLPAVEVGHSAAASSHDAAKHPKKPNMCFPIRSRMHPGGPRGGSASPAGLLGNTMVIVSL